ncbi:MAG: hypothetical protein IT379_12195 [Deltaproteobacteria bacterium]|nr:hypothetical protein [Deltaproteobacteria bacterium]
MILDRPTGALLALAATLLLACDDDDRAGLPDGAAADAGLGDGARDGASELDALARDADVPDAADPSLYPTAPAPPSLEACRADQEAHWTFETPAACVGRRTCIDARGRFHRDGAPWIPRGVYHGGIEVEHLLASCPAGAACETTQPRDHGAYVAMLADAGFDVILEHHDRLSPGLRAAIAAEPRVGTAHLLFGDPFSREGHDALVAEIERAAADPDVWLWFGPDEPDLNRTWPMATGIKRLLRGASTEIDALLAGRYRPSTGEPYLPSGEPAHDPEGMPFASAVVIDEAGLAVAADVYDALVPVTYPFQEPYSRADDGPWSVLRVSRFARAGVPTTPVLQMVGIDVLGLIRPSPDHVRTSIVSSLVHGAAGAFYFKLAGDDPPFAGRDGWFAADDRDAWTAYTETHALWDRLVPVLFGDATDERGTHDVLHWRRLTLGDRRVLVIANPTPYHRAIDLDAILARAPHERVRSYVDCAPFATRALEVPGYATYVLEVTPTDDDRPAPPGDPLAHLVEPPIEPPPSRPLEGIWETLAPLASGRSSHAALRASDTAIVLAGGYAASLRAGVDVLAYDVGSGTTEARPALASPVASAAASSGPFGLVVAGGQPELAIDDVVVPSAACQRLPSGSASFASCAPLGNGPVSLAAYATHRDRLYVFGGVVRFDPEGGNTATTVVSRYDAADDAWRAETHLPDARVSASAFVHGDVVYVAGGFAVRTTTGRSELAREVLAYDLRAHRWLAAAEPGGASDLPSPRAALACAVVAGFAYCAGGYDDAGDALDTVERLDLSTGEWSAVAPLPEPLSDLGVTAMDAALVVTGGVTSSFADSPRVHRLR